MASPSRLLLSCWLVPGFPLLKEWAYAGVTFAWIMGDDRRLLGRGWRAGLGHAPYPPGTAGRVLCDQACKPSVWNPLSVFRERFGAPRALVGMLHVGPLPGTPAARDSIDQLIERTVAEARIYRDAGFTALAMENMHDRPYLKGGVGPEITAAMTALAREVKRETGLMLGIQVLGRRESGGAGGRPRVRRRSSSEWRVSSLRTWRTRASIESCAGELLRYRRAIGAERVLVFADIKKKHSAHAITGGRVAGRDRQGRRALSRGRRHRDRSCQRRRGPPRKCATPREPWAPGDRRFGVSAENLARYCRRTQGFIVGSSLKQGGIWSNPLDRAAVESLASAFARA